MQPWSQLVRTPVAAGTYPSFCMKPLGVFLLPFARMLVHHRLVSLEFVRFPQQFTSPGGERHCARVHNSTARSWDECGGHEATVLIYSISNNWFGFGFMALN